MGASTTTTSQCQKRGRATSRCGGSDLAVVRRCCGAHSSCDTSSLPRGRPQGAWWWWWWWWWDCGWFGRDDDSDGCSSSGVCAWRVLLRTSTTPMGSRRVTTTTAALGRRRRLRHQPSVTVEATVVPCGGRARACAHRARDVGATRRPEAHDERAVVPRARHERDAHELRRGRARGGGRFRLRTATTVTCVRVCVW